MSRLARIGGHRQLQRGDALLGDADHGDLPRQPGNQARRDGTALVEHKRRDDAASFELSDRRDSRRAVQLLVGAQLDVQIVVRSPARGDEVLDRLEQHQQRPLVIERAPPVHRQPVLAVGHGAGERGMRPAGLGPVLGRGRHDVLVGHEQHVAERGGTGAGTGSGEAQQHPRAPGLGDLGGREHAGVQLVQQFLERREHLRLLRRQRPFEGCHRRHLHHAGQALGQHCGSRRHGTGSSSGRACALGDDVNATFGTVSSAMRAATAAAEQISQTVM